ncbi:hypothetical protein FA95DRAFT_1581639 [Auriscalpium vulgare]|uniref:Uncharacterized protein n=1 Tax=Auriscalpium vulgare TaxID=40419 RepID=A0ACB8S0D0_9AGAM|nr:hypothetical protein FA95DRAFT_1581639 [Auriscalpium vulgare]
MAKSMRSKVKRAFRAKKRETGVYAAVEAARLHRLNTKLVAKAGEDVPAATEEEEAMSDDLAKVVVAAPDAMELDGAKPSATAERISTHGPRDSRREQWRASKGMEPRAAARGMNRQGTVAARRKSGRPNRRR